MDHMDKYREWLDKLPDGDPLRKELEDIEGRKNEIKERFYSDLSFGTAGLRGIISAGTNRMNIYTVGRASQGVADYIVSQGQEAMDRGIVIAHDPRHFSAEFCRAAAAIFAANGIKTFVFPDLRPTPELAFMIRKLGAVSGVNITASHNPKNYNGYKVYWSDGCQVGSETADAMTQMINSHDYFSGINWGSYDEAAASGMIKVLGPEADREYLELVEAQAIHSGDELDLSIPIVYTPLNGAGAKPFSRMMNDRGFTNWHMVPEQSDPDPDFTTVGYPNPEASAAFDLSRKLGREVGAELLMATDPDSDRFAIEVADGNGAYIHLNGNQTGYILVNYILEGRRSAGTLPENGAMVKSIVTSTMSSEIARSYGVRMFESLTGFKNICGRIPGIEEQGYEYLFGYEESVGYAACPYIRDKDGISAGMLVAEAAAYYRKQGRTLSMVLEELYRRYGYYSEDEPNLVLEGIEGSKRIGRIMSAIRGDPPQEVAGYKVEKLTDYQNGCEDIPPSNVLRFYLEGCSWFAIRPSGTEPKIKFYFYTRQDSRRKALQVNSAVREDLMKKVESIK